MSKGGKCEYDDVMRFKANLERFQGRELDALARRICNTIAKELVSDVKKLTPPGSGHLKKRWQQSAARKKGNHWEVNVYNTAPYAIYVEVGHLTCKPGVKQRWVPGYWKESKEFVYVPGAKTGMLLKQQWVKGRFMLARAQKQLDKKARIIIAEEVKKKLGEMFG